MNENSSDSIIRITKEEATSGRVDDLLKRQMSMRGEPGVTRDRRRPWYFQNWLVLALAGLLGAIAAWALIEPFFEDLLYVQGPISEFDPNDSPGNRVIMGDHALVFRRGLVGSFQISGEKIYLVAGVKELTAHGSRRLDLEQLHNGDVVGAYVEYHPGIERDVAVALDVTLAPRRLSPERLKMTLSQLQARTNAAALLTFAVVAGLIGLFVGATDGLICRLPRRALLCGGVGLLVGIVGGFVCSLVANLVYSPLNHLAVQQIGDRGMYAVFGFLLQVMGRSLAWSLAGVAMGLGQGIALRSQRLLIYGVIGGLLGGLFGGMLFDPIDQLLLGGERVSAQWSRLIGFAVIGLSVGGMIGIVELLARDAWLRMTQGPLTGKEFLLFKDTMTIGSSPRSDVYLFNDPQVAKQHARIRSAGDECEIESTEAASPVLLNGRAVTRTRLRHGDNITIGRTSFVFQRRKS